MTYESLVNLILLFFTYAFLGWCIEVTLKYFQFHRFINRGFLTGPWLPIYGSGAALITIAAKALSPLESSVGTTFVISFILCGVIEYLTSYFLEKRFHARWWDYSQKPMNLHGRGIESRAGAHCRTHEPAAAGSPGDFSVSALCC